MNAHLALTKSNWSMEAGKPLLTDAIADSSKKQKFYEGLVDAYTKSWISDKRSWYKDCFDRYVDTSNFGAVQVLTQSVESVSSLAIGHGGVSALETGLALHRIYGVPYLPGSALKGLAAHYAHHVLGENHEALKQGEADYEVLFGTQSSAGFVVFHDALIAPDTVANALKQDVLTPHHQAYNQIVIAEGNEKKEYPHSAPRDDDSPVPVPFLAVQGTFEIVLTCEGESQTAGTWLEFAKTILLLALEHEGIGAKTNAGYGRMRAYGN